MTAECIRLFVALELPVEIRERLLAWRSEAVRELSGLRLLDPEQLHVTLCFLGWQDSAAAQDIAAASQASASTATAPKLALGRPVWLPPRRSRVLAVELDDPEDGLARLQSALSARLAAGGWYVPERRPYRGHVTVARVRPSASGRPSPLAGPPGLSFTASLLTLFRSVLSPAGARYEALATVSLG